MEQTKGDKSGLQDMEHELRERRDDIFQELVVKGRTYREVVNEISERHDTPVGTVKTDIYQMENWVPKLAVFDDDEGVGRLREMKKNRERLHALASEARKEGDTELELKIRRTIDKAIETHVELAQSLGQAHKEADKHEIESAGDAYANLVGAASELSEEEKRALEEQAMAEDDALDETPGVDGSESGSDEAEAEDSDDSGSGSGSDEAEAEAEDNDAWEVDW